MTDNTVGRQPTSDHYDQYADVWREKAACRTVDQDLFYPPKGLPYEAAKAKAVCASCPVRQDCLEYALANGERHGIWGGLAPRERHRLRKAAS